MNVVTDFGMDPERVRAARYAAKLAQALGGELVLRTDGTTRTDRTALDRAVREHVSLEQTEITVVDPSMIAARRLSEGGIYVAAYREIAQLDDLPRGTQVLFSHDESCLMRKEGQAMKICLPFGDQAEAAFANLHAVLPIAKALGASIVGLHATYRDSRSNSSEPRAHMNLDARVVETGLSRLATEAGVEFSSHIGMDVELVPFVNRAATDLDCTIIAVARGRALRDGYADEVERTTNLPTLMLAIEGGAR